MKMNLKPIPPSAKKNPVLLEKHHDIRTDPYYWMKERDHPEVLNYLKQENQYVKEVTQPIQPLIDDLYNEMVGRIKQDDQSVPYYWNQYYYLTKYEEGAEYPIYVRKKSLNTLEEEILIDGNERAKGLDFYETGGRSVSPDNKYLAFGEDTVGRRIYTIKFKNLLTGEFLKEEIQGTTGHAVWANDNATLFYTIRDEETLRAYKVMKHRLGEDPKFDSEVFEETDVTFSTFVTQTKSQKYILIGCHHSITKEYRYLHTDEPDGQFVIFEPREKGIEYELDHDADHFCMLTNYEAENFKICLAPLAPTPKKLWNTWIEHNPEVLIEDLEVFESYLAIQERYRGLSRIRIVPKTGASFFIDFNEKAYLVNLSVNPNYQSTQLRIAYQSMAIPPTVYDFDMDQRSLNLLKQQEVLGGFVPEHYTTDRFFIKARDGKEIPVSLVHRKDVKRTPQTPLLLYAYGSYGHSMEPYFSSIRISLLERGFIFAIAHIRGGEEMGRHWYEDGKLLNKRNTFFDFIDVADQLNCNPDNLFAMGGSAGGLLMGAVMNMRPDLWKGLVASVPFVDVVTTMLDDSIPLTTFEYDEWGNPEEETFYHYMKSYSPYDNVEEKEYPALLVTTGYHDSQVQYWEPAKWVAKLRDLKQDSNPLLFHINMDAGHGGASGRFSSLKEVALEYAFILDLAGIK
jgi:oligopeptidase B